MRCVHEEVAVGALLLHGHMRSAALAGQPKTRGEPDLSAQSMLAPAKQHTMRPVKLCAHANADLNPRPQ